MTVDELRAALAGVPGTAAVRVVARYGTGRTFALEVLDAERVAHTVELSLPAEHVTRRGLPDLDWETLP